jgi:phage tail-like protein
MPDRHDPLRNFRFRLEIDGIDQAGFSEVAIGDSSTDVIDYREGNEPKHLRKLSGLAKFAAVTLKWGITESTALADWRQLVVDDGPLDAARRTVVIRLEDEAGTDKAAFEIVNAWPSKYDPSDLNGTGNAVAVDSLELVHEGIKRIQ